MDNMIDFASKAIKVMDSSNSWDMQFGEERTLCLSFDEIEVASFVVVVRNMQSIKITLVVLDTNQQVVFSSSIIESNPNKR